MEVCSAEQFSQGTTVFSFLSNGQIREKLLTEYFIFIIFLQYSFSQNGTFVD